jgi:hypothetical protein
MNGDSHMISGWGRAIVRCVAFRPRVDGQLRAAVERRLVRRRRRPCVRNRSWSRTGEPGRSQAREGVPSRLAPALLWAAVLGLASLPLTAGPALAADPHIEAVSLSSADVAASGVALGQVTVTTSVRDWTGGEDTAIAVLTRTSAGVPGAPQAMVADLTRTSGVPGSGTYQGVVPVPSTATGGWRVSAISEPFSADRNVIARDPRQDGVPDALLTVHGTHLPRLRLSVQPQILPYPQTQYTVTATFTTDTGAPLAGRPIRFSERPTDDCNLGNGGVPTDANGRAFHTLSWAAASSVCVWAGLPVGPMYYGTAFAGGDIAPRYGVKLAAAPAGTSVKRGASVLVNGNVAAVGTTPLRAAAAGTHVRLQWLFGRTWRNVNLAYVTTSGRFHLVATPPDPGRNIYRVWFPSQGRYVGTITRNLTITTT